MKKQRIISVLLTLILVFTNIQIYAKPGDAAGNIYTTDIVAYIDNMAVPSYNIGGKTVVIAEELVPYGFSYVWDNNLRRLSVYTEAMPQQQPDYIPQKSKVSGRIAGTVYETDIVALVNGMQVESYNIGGRTALVIEDMGSCDDEAKRMSRDGNPHRVMGYSVALMRFEWNAQKRTISLFTVRPKDKISTAYGDMTVKSTAPVEYKNGSYSLSYEDETYLSHWISNIHYNGEVYISIDELKGCNNINLSGAGAVLTQEGLNFTYPAENIKPVLHTNSGTVGSCHNGLIVLEDTLFINEKPSKTETADFILYRGSLFVGENALNSAFGQEVLSYKYALPQGCTEKLDVSRESQVIVYINGNYINSFNTLNGKCYISAKDLIEHGFNVSISGNKCNITSPENAVKLERDAQYPDTYTWGTPNPKYELHPIYNGVYDVTVDEKPMEDVYVHTALVYRSPCIDAVELAELALYTVDTSDPYKVQIYTE